jgi:hypothetical protein
MNGSRRVFLLHGERFSKLYYLEGLKLSIYFQTRRRKKRRSDGFCCIFHFSFLKVPADMKVAKLLLSFQEFLRKQF